MKTTRRRFLLSALTAPAFAALAVKGASAQTEDRTRQGQTIQPKNVGTFTLPPLSYGFDALEPYIDRQTMQLHHEKHHSGWVWLARARDGKLDIASGPNQDNPIMDGAYPVMGNDV